MEIIFKFDIFYIFRDLVKNSMSFSVVRHPLSRYWTYYLILQQVLVPEHYLLKNLQVI